MPTSLTFDEHITALEAAGPRLIAAALDAGMDAPVPTCPAWTARDLVAHQTMVHRWATAHIRGDDPDAVPDETEISTSVSDLPGYFRDGLAALTTALVDAPSDLAAMTFLKDAPPPREFWARRQAHETTIHMVDSVAATAGRLPTAEETGIDGSLAADGVDELLRGFFTRGRSKLYDDSEYTLAIEANDVDRRWILRVGPRLAVEPGDNRAERDDIAATITGTAVQLYLALWNRGAEVDVTGRTDVLDHWRSTQHVTWS